MSIKKLWVVLKYELKEYFSAKGFMIFTIVLSVLGAGALFLPRFLDMSDLTGVKVENGQIVEDYVEMPDAEPGEEPGEEPGAEPEDPSHSWEGTTYAIIDEIGILDSGVLQAFFFGDEWVVADSAEDMTLMVKNEEAEAGFYVKDMDSYEYYVFNKGMYDVASQMFAEAMNEYYRMVYCGEHGLDYEEISMMYYHYVEGTDVVINKDTEENFWYCYALIIIVFMLIVMYGQMIAVSVTNEKSNRAVEVLVTSTNPNNLLFGKVLSGAIGGLFQAGLIMGSILFSYSINREYWGGMLDMMLNIPSEVVLSFAFFGLGGYIFYAFLFGAMGALVSKTEDVSKSSGGLMMIIMVVYFIALTSLNNVDGTLIKVLSFLPFSSYSTMFARIAMGTVATWEIVLSFAILVASIVLAGILGAAIYRMGTLRYGNPIKITTALKSLRKKD